MPHAVVWSWKALRERKTKTNMWLHISLFTQDSVGLKHHCVLGQIPDQSRPRAWQMKVIQCRNWREGKLQRGWMLGEIYWAPPIGQAQKARTIKKGKSENKVLQNTMRHRSNGLPGAEVRKQMRMAGSLELPGPHVLFKLCQKFTW